jgi:hypothetical protein
MDREQSDIAKLTGAFLKMFCFQHIEIPSYCQKSIRNCATHIRTLPRLCMSCRMYTILFAVHVPLGCWYKHFSFLYNSVFQSLSIAMWGSKWGYPLAAYIGSEVVSVQLTYGCYLHELNTRNIEYVNRAIRSRRFVSESTGLELSELLGWD